MTQSQDVDKIMMINENDFAADQNGDKIVQDMQSKTVGQKQQMQEQNLIDIDQLQNELDEMQAYTDAKNFESQKPLIHNNHNSRNLFEKHANSQAQSRPETVTTGGYMDTKEQIVGEDDFNAMLDGQDLIRVQDG